MSNWWFIRVVKDLIGICVQGNVIQINVNVNLCIICCAIQSVMEVSHVVINNYTITHIS